eukprot:Protomagalhaensia_wolfi_Nauph_80__3912@NODE_396_length_2611_cov_285_088647_g300_i0_p4_GENE_NODE_396_length_2611_cov_285_088647_g300_i0NODE_396_length_2611_cov_285_088647_g300_i0_p4_ORF_typecomplete_len128_score4_96BTB/PF00651_31/2e08BTB/PF00651_31/1_3BACK/PF07707_15/22BACK/PF07707_15/0_013DUF1265/PF06887_14/81DUF1265/PF06887_14/0_71_NODE_396_length_2611_cov_285_088647_g300_i0332715
MPAWPYHSFRAMLEFLYSGSYETGHDYEQVCETLRIADHFGVEELRTACEHDLMDMINIQNVCNLLKQADRCQAKNLKEKCLVFVFEHGDDVMRYAVGDHFKLFLYISTQSFSDLASCPSLLMEVAR